MSQKKLPFGSPFYHLNPSLLTNGSREHDDEDDDLVCDEYGFKVKVMVKANHHHQVSKVDPREENDEDERIYIENKSKWIKFLENEYEKLAPSSCLDLSQFDADIQRVPQLEEMILSSITNELRPFFWLRFSKALVLKIESKWTYTQLLDLSSDERTLTMQQIVQVLPDNVCFNHPDSPCSQRLRRILRIIQWYQKTNLNENIDLNQLNVSLIGAHLLLVCPEEDAFWLLLKITRELNVQNLIEIITLVMAKCCPIVNGLLLKHDIEFKLVASIWFSSLLAGFVRNSKLLFAIWDLYFFEGPILLVQIIIGLLIIETKPLECCQDSKEFFNNLSDLPTNSFESLQKIMYAWKSGKNIVSNLNLPAQLYHYDPQTGADHLLERTKLKENGDQDQDRIKNKNIKQTALIMKLHEAIVAIAQHFQAYDPQLKYDLNPDYDNVDKVDHREDLAIRLRPYRRHAKALIDFPGDDPDELTFRQNDILTVINEKDEHCWIGELDGRIGWFPAKFVEVLNEHKQDYCIAGDDRIVPFINDLVRGKLCSALKAIFGYDLKKSYFFTIHPWTIIEEISNACTNSDFKSVYSRLVLTKTFGLDEFARVLSPLDLLFRSIALINTTHGDCAMDIKLRSLICLGLNQYVLHDWLELICVSQPSIIYKSYGQNSFLITPAWRMIKAELKLLVQFSFNLNPRAEIDQNQEPKSPVTKEGVCDMLVKYHLFSWDI